MRTFLSQLRGFLRLRQTEGIFLSSSRSKTPVSLLAPLPSSRIFSRLLSLLLPLAPPSRLLPLLLVLRFTAFPTVFPASELSAEVSRSPNFFSSSGSLAPGFSRRLRFFSAKAVACPSLSLALSRSLSFSLSLSLARARALVFVFALRPGQQIRMIASPRRNIGPFPARLHAPPQFCTIFLAARLVTSLACCVH